MSLREAIPVKDKGIAAAERGDRKKAVLKKKNNAPTRRGNRNFG
jgi:hypothetical protein